MSALHERKATIEDYFELESSSEFKHEYVNGEILAMAGAKRNHTLIVASFGASLYSIARSKGCETYASDMRLRTPSGHYRSIPTLQTYLMIDQDAPHVEMHARQPDNNWLLRDTIGLKSEIRIESLDATLRLRDIYAQVDFEDVADQQ